jgi:hypothetical protein
VRASNPWNRLDHEMRVVCGGFAFVPRLRLGTQDLDREVYLVHQSAPEFLRGIAGYLGIASLEAKEITFDFERNELSWKK